MKSRTTSASRSRAVAGAALMLAGCVASAAAHAASGEDEAMLDMSLEQLLSVRLRVPAALTKLTRLETPAATTVISAEDIRLTPARNLYDLIDVYVPGANWMMSATGPKLGVRGNISSRNYKYLLLVDGRVMNDKATVGASSELEMWDLGDIEQIEVVSGPGSVTYGPGAVAGVISITTRKPEHSQGSTASAGYTGPYQSRQLALSRQQDGGWYQMFAHLSVVRTPGQPARTFQVANNNTLGYVGQDFRPTSQPLDYYGDYQGQPQIKAHVELAFPGGWRWWTRYTQQGSDWFSNEVKTVFNGQPMDQQGLRSRQLSSTVNHEMALGSQLQLATMVSLGSYDFERRQEQAFSPDPGNALNYRVNYAADQLIARATLNWQPAGWAQVALGGEWSRDHYRHGWGDRPQQMRMGESGEIINGPDSEALKAGSGGDANRTPGAPAIYVGNGWSSNTSSLFTEANLALSPAHKLLLSGRADKNSYSNWLLSPRVAWIATLAEGQLLKLTAQRSSRMNTASQLFANVQRGIENQPERLDALELRYSAQPSKALALDLSLFHEDEEVVVFQGIDNTNRLVGQLKLNGLEGSLRYALAHGHVGLSVSAVKQQSWKMAAGVSSNNVSFADYNLPINGTGNPLQRQLGLGNDLNNWPNDAVKLFGDYRPGERLTLHADARWYSQLRGARDGLEALRQAVAGTPAATPAFYAALDRIGAEHAYGSEVRFNLLADYALAGNSNVQLYGMNLFSRGSGKRYAFDEASNTAAAPRTVRYVVEPAAWGIRLIHRF